MTPFTATVLAVVRGIPQGSVLTYGEVARLAGFPGAYRAVGSVMANNVNPTVPCHRVIRSDGVLGAYNRGGPERKMQLLESEGVAVIKKSNCYIVKKS